MLVVCLKEYSHIPPKNNSIVLGFPEIRNILEKNKEHWELTEEQRESSHPRFLTFFPPFPEEEKPSAEELQLYNIKIMEQNSSNLDKNNPYDSFRTRSLLDQINVGSAETARFPTKSEANSNIKDNYFTFGPQNSNFNFTPQSGPENLQNPYFCTPPQPFMMNPEETSQKPLSNASKLRMLMAQKKK